MPDLERDRSTGWSRRSGRAPGRADRRSTAGSPTATTASGSASATTSCGCRARTPGCSGSAARPSGWPPRPPARLGIAPGWSRPARAAWSPRSSRPCRSTPSALRAEPGVGGPRAAALSRLRAASCRPASGCPTCSTTTRAIVARARRPRCPDGYGGDAGARRGGSPTALPLSDPVPCHDDLLAGQPARPRRPGACCSSTGSTPGWATGCSTSATCGQQRLRRGGRRAAADRLLRRAAERRRSGPRWR